MGKLAEQYRHTVNIQENPVYDPYDLHPVVRQDISVLGMEISVSARRAYEKNDVNGMSKVHIQVTAKEALDLARRLIETAVDTLRIEEQQMNSLVHSALEREAEFRARDIEE